MGIKAAKKARKAHNQDFASSDADLEELAKSNQAMASANAAKALALQEIAEDKIMSRAPELMEGDRREYYLLKQSKILARIKAKWGSILFSPFEDMLIVLIWFHDTQWELINWQQVKLNRKSCIYLYFILMMTQDLDTMKWWKDLLVDERKIESIK